MDLPWFDLAELLLWSIAKCEAKLYVTSQDTLRNFKETKTIPIRHGGKARAIIDSFDVS